MSQVRLFQQGEFKLHGGAPSKWKIDCDALSSDEIETVALMLAEILPPFGSVEGVPTGGLRLAESMRQFRTSGPLLIVDDVLTTGGSIEECRNGREAIGAVIFARGKCPTWVTPLFSLAPVLAEALLARQPTQPVKMLIHSWDGGSSDLLCGAEVIWGENYTTFSDKVDCPACLAKLEPVVQPAPAGPLGTYGRHPHEPEEPPILDKDGRCLVCCRMYADELKVTVSSLRARIAALEVGLKRCAQIAWNMQMEQFGGGTAIGNAIHDFTRSLLAGEAKP
jgi:hypothetical protein